jgi:hypothetical protein
MDFWITLTVGVLVGMGLSFAGAFGVGYWFLKNKKARTLFGEQLLEDARDMLAYQEENPSHPTSSQAPVIGDINWRSRPMNNPRW